MSKIIKKLTEVLNIPNPDVVLPTKEEAERIIEAKALYEKHGKDVDWTKKNFIKCPWGIAYMVSHRGRNSDPNKALSYLALAIILEWQELIDQLKRTITNHKVSKTEVEYVRDTIWAKNCAQMATTINSAYSDPKVQKALNESLTETIEKHEELNPKLFDGKTLKPEVRQKILEIVDEFVDDLTSDEVDFNIEDIILIGSNVSYNYTKDSDLDIHLVANTKSLNCPDNIINALYSAYRSLFNRKFDIDFYGIPVEIYVETEDSARVSNGVYSVKDNDWIKEPELTDIPELDQEAFDKLYQEWEAKCKDLIKEIEAGNLEDEADIVTMIEEIYELRKSGISEGEYSIQNLVFKELRNNKYLDDLKEYKDELIAKRLSL